MQVALEAQEDFYRLMARGKLGQTGFRTWLRTSAYTIQQVSQQTVMSPSSTMGIRCTSYACSQCAWQTRVQESRLQMTDYK